MARISIDPANQWVPTDIGVQDTAAYQIIRQVTDHTWGSEMELSDDDIITIYHSFRELGGSWEALMGGDMSSVKKLEDSIDALVAPRKMDQEQLDLYTSA
jgi:hypothetical protein